MARKAIIQIYKPARRNYRDRQIDKWWKWSWEARGKVKYKALVSYQDKYKLKVYG